MYLGSILKPIPVTPDSYFFGSSNPKPSIFTVCSQPPVILREAEGEVAESTDMNEPTPSRRGGTVNKDRLWPGKNTFTDPLTCPARLLIPKGEDFPLIFETVDSATPGKSCVQKDL